jgi:O-antigen/teichoic acid export membrane protein
VRKGPTAPATVESLPSRSELRSLVISGIRWKIASQVALHGISFASTLTLARLLTPRDFGLASMALVFASLAVLLADVGLSPSLVQRRELTEEDRSTAFWTNAGLGCALSLAGVGLSWPLADVYHQPQVQPLFAVLSLTFLFTAFGTTQGALLIRGLRFRSLELRTIASTSVSLAVGVPVAALGYGPWAIIALSLANSGVSTVLLWWISPWRPRFLYSYQSLRHLLGYGGWIFGSGLVTYVERNADSFLVGRFRGPASLGAYGVAYNIMIVPIMRLALPLQQVFFPALSRIEEPKEVGAISLRMTRILAAVAVPALLGMAVLAPDFVVVVFGDKWRAAIHVLQILAWVGILQTVGSSQTSTLLQAIGRPGMVFCFSIASAILSVAAFAIGLQWGIVGVAAAYAIANTLLVPYYVASGARAVGVSLSEFGAALAGVVQAAAVMALAVLGLRIVLLHQLSAGPRLVLLIAVGIAIYVPLCSLRAPEVVREIRSARRSRSGDSEVGIPSRPR